MRRVDLAGLVVTVFTVMTFNLLSAAIADAPPWSLRGPVAQEILSACDPDLLGVQEATRAQVEDVLAWLPGRAWFGLGRDGGERGEFNAVFVREAAFAIEATDQVWLSATPRRAGSLAFHAAVPRVVTWARLRERASGRALTFANTHLDFESAPSREASARALVDLARGAWSGAPIVLVGDFNADAGASATYRVLIEEGPFEDAWQPERDGPVATPTFHGWGTHPHDAGRIDWILLAGGVTSTGARVAAFERGGIYASDHHPVVARIELP